MEPTLDHGLSDSLAEICNLHFAICNWQSVCFSLPQIDSVDLLSTPRISDSKGSISFPASDTREIKMRMNAPWVRSLEKLGMGVSTEGWRFPAPIEPDVWVARPESSKGVGPLQASTPFAKPQGVPPNRAPSGEVRQPSQPPRRLRPSADTVLFEERLF